MFLKLLFVLSCISLIKSQKDFYYWRDFYGRIPKDAFQSEVDPQGRPTYVGQTYFPDKHRLFPTVITEGEPAWVVHGAETFKSDQRTKILCSTNNSLFKWVSTDNGRISKIKCHKIVGGIHPPQILVNIGRATMLTGTYRRGRVYSSDGLFGLWTYNALMRDEKLTTFEVLTYNCPEPY